jgi:hypothetical protein
MDSIQMYVFLMNCVCLHQNEMVIQGKTRNFANPALREAVIVFFYTGPYRVARKRPEIFRKQVPLPCLALVAAAVFIICCSI